MYFGARVFGKGKSKYSFGGNLLYFLKEIKRWDKTFFYILILGFIPPVAAGFVETLLPAKVVADLEAELPLARVLLNLGSLSLVAWICNTFSGMLEAHTETMVESLGRYFQRKYIHKMMDVDYEFLENQEFQKVSSNVADTAERGRGLYMVVSLPLIIKDILLWLIYGILLCTANPILAVMVMATVFISLRLLALARKKHGQFYGELSMQARRVRYINTQSWDSAAGKDIRIYRMLDWFLKKFDRSLDSINNTFGKIHTWYMVRNLSDAFVVFARNAVVYGYLLYQLVQGNISASMFVFYIGLVNGMADNFENVLRMLMELNSTSMTISYIRNLLGVQDEWKRGEGVGEQVMKELLEKPLTLELKDVSFTYPGNGAPTLSHIDLTIRPGEKLALIGLNGAGKTTLVKLICGFYHPTEGTILINGISRERFSREEYERLIGVLFQDSTYLPLSLDENITAGESRESMDKERLASALDYSGFIKRYERLDHKGETKLVKEVNENAVDFSGGERQKLMFARALYKGAPFIILDEPTAALDPIAENELYMNFDRAVNNATALYISHRLSSTRFCDRIVVLQDGSLKEEGTHEELMAAGGIYAGLFEMQSQYYKEERERKENERRRQAAFGEEGAALDMEGGLAHE